MNFVLDPHSSLEWYCWFLHLEFSTSLISHASIPYSKPDLLIMARSQRKKFWRWSARKCSKREKIVLLCGLAFLWLFPDCRQCHVSNKNSAHWNCLWNSELMPQQKELDVVGLGWVQYESCTVSCTWLTMDSMKGISGWLSSGTVPCADRDWGECCGWSYVSCEEGRQGHRAERAFSPGLISPFSWGWQPLPIYESHIWLQPSSGRRLEPAAWPWLIAGQTPLFQLWKGSSPLANALEWRKPRAMWPSGRGSHFWTTPNSQVRLQRGFHWELLSGSSLLESWDYHLPGDKPWKVWNFSFVVPVRERKAAGERHLIPWSGPVKSPPQALGMVPQGSVWCLCVCKWTPWCLVNRNQPCNPVLCPALTHTPLWSKHRERNAFIRATFHLWTPWLHKQKFLVGRQMKILDNYEWHNNSLFVYLISPLQKTFKSWHLKYHFTSLQHCFDVCRNQDRKSIFSEKIEVWKGELKGLER